jgi:hypothetical protein
VLEQDFSGLIFADSHSAFGTYPGAGILYYALGVLVRSQVSVCIGSGGGFVPSLMRRAQLDMGIDPSTTFLIDANLPDLAFGSPTQLGGWMTPANAFLQRESDIAVLGMLSKDAAPLLAAGGLQIDHLHIDGDHSRRGVLADWDDYAPLLSKTSVVSLHDTRMPGVAKAITDIMARRPDLELLNFPEVGAGTAVLRHRVARTIARRPQSGKKLADPNRKISLEQGRVRAQSALSQAKAVFERWHYLESDAFRARYRLALDWVDQAGVQVVEVGGFPNSIVPLLSHSKTAHVVEPYAPQSFRSGLASAATARGITLALHEGGLGEVGFEPQKSGAPYNLVILGLDIASAAEDAPRLRRAFFSLLEYIAAAGRVAIEVPNFPMSILCFNALIDILQPVMDMDITLDLRRDPAAIDYHVIDDRALRRLVFFYGGLVLNVEDPRTVARVDQLVAEVQDRKARASQPSERPIYQIGIPVSFALGGAGTDYVVSGFSGPEARFRWMTGDESRLIFRIDLSDAALMYHGGLTLELDVRPFVAPPGLAWQDIAIAVAGKTLHQARLGERQILQCHIPPSLIFGKALIEVTILHPDNARPIDVIEGSKDTKPLSFALYHARIDLADTIPPNSGKKNMS